MINKKIMALSLVLYTGLCFGSGLYMGCSTTTNKRVDETKNKSLESLSDWGAVNQLLEKGLPFKALTMACMIQQAVKKSDQNLCEPMIKSIIDERKSKYQLKSKQSIRLALNGCIKKNLTIDVCLKTI